MAVKIRLRQQGSRNNLRYRLVVTDSRTKRDGKYIECLGWYNPEGETDEQKMLFQADRVQHWLDQGAELTEKAASLVKRTSPEVITRLREKELAKRNKRRLARKQD